MPGSGHAHATYGVYLAAHADPPRDNEALEALTRAVSLAPELRQRLPHDPALARLRDDPRFEAIFVEPERP